jgi:hypothetical protein
MSFKTTLLLMVVLAAVCVGGYFGGLFSSSASDRTDSPNVVDAKAMYLILPKLGRVDRLTLEVADRGQIVCEHVGDEWQIVQPVQMRADGYAMDSLVSAIVEARVEQRFVPGSTGQVTLEQTGLDQPFATAKLVSGDREVTVLFGRNVVASENTYMKLADAEDAIVSDDNFRKLIKRDLSEYRDKQVWQARKDRITELTCVGRDGEKFVIVRDGATWRMTSPVSAAVDASAIDGALGTLATLRAEEFVADAPESLDRYGLASPAWTVTMTQVDKVMAKADATASAPTTQSTQPIEKRTTYAVAIGSSTGLGRKSVYATVNGRPWVVTLAEDVAKAIVPDVQTWREKRLVDFGKEQLNRIETTYGGGSATLVREDDEWVLAVSATSHVPADSAAVEKLVDAVVGLKAASFVDEAGSQMKETQLDRPTGTIRLTSAKGELIELTFGAETASGMYRYVQRAGVAYACAVDAEAVTTVFQPVLAYRHRLMMNFGMDDVTAMTVTRDGATYRLSRTGVESPWRLSEPVASAADAKTMRDLLLTCTTLQADAWVSQGELAKFGLDRPDVVLELETTTQVVAAPTSEPAVPMASQPTTSSRPATRQMKQTHRLAVSQHGGAFYACVGGDSPMVARVSEKVLKDVSAELVDRRLFHAMAIEKIDALELHRADGVLKFTKLAGQWTYPADRLVKVDGGKIRELLQAMASQQAVRFMGYDAGKAAQYVSSQPYLRVTASANGSTSVLKFGRVSDGGRFAVASPGPGWACEISAADVQKFDKPLKAFVVSATPAEASQGEPMESDGF